MLGDLLFVWLRGKGKPVRLTGSACLAYDGNFFQLVKGGSDIEARDDAGRTPLCVAAWEGQIRSIDRLVELNADPTVVDM